MHKVQWRVPSTAQIGVNQVLPALGKSERSHVAGPDGAVANTRVIDACFRSGRSGTWGRP